MPYRRLHVAIVLVLIVCYARIEAHQDSCHRRHSCFSGHGTSVCGDRGRCDQCPDHQYCLAGQPRVAASPNPGLPPTASTSSQLYAPAAMTVCFTPGGNCTAQIVTALG